MTERGPTEDHSAQLDALKHHVEQMADLAVRMVEGGTRALLDNDAAGAQSVIAEDPALDKFDVDIETEAIRLMAIIQPEGSVLRTLGATLKIANCVDRVGRLGYDLARMLTDAPEPSDASHKELLRKMDEHSRAMVLKAVQSFIHNDAVEAKQIFAMDDEVDALYYEVQKRLITLLQQGGVTVPRLAHEILAARHLERVGDNACKIAEKAIYAITGERRTEYFPALAHKTAAGRIIP
jgi:phosphate transport system protein